MCNIHLPPGRVPATDVFGAFALCCAEREEPKISFIFNLIDLNHDRHVNRTELTMLMYSVCRGFARLKCINSPAMDLIQIVVDCCFEHPEVHLNPRGEISLQDVQLFLKADDRCRHYLGNNHPRPPRPRPRRRRLHLRPVGARARRQLFVVVS